MATNGTGGVSENTSIDEGVRQYGEEGVVRAKLTAEDRKALRVAAIKDCIDSTNDLVTLLEELMRDHVMKRAWAGQEPNAEYVAGWERRIADNKACIALLTQELVELGAAQKTEAA